MARQPWFKFFPTDWRADPQLRMCSLAARGLWVELLGIMHESTERGLLLVNGQKVTPKHIAILVGCSEAEVTHHLLELENAGVFSRKKNEVIFSRRMERDENLSRKNRENGQKGGLASLGKERGNGGSLERKSKPQKPEARSQIEEAGASSPPDPQGGEGDDEPAEEPIKAKRQAPLVSDADLKGALTSWNEMAARAGLGQVETVKDERRRKLAARIADCGGLEGWQSLLKRIEASRFLTGRVTNFRANFNWLLSPSNIIKLREGNYDDRPSNGARSGGRKPNFADELGAAFDARGVPRNAFSPGGEAGFDAERAEVPAGRNADAAGGASRRRGDIEDAEILGAEVFE